MNKLRAFLGQNLQHLATAGRIAPAITALALFVAISCSVAVTVDDRDAWELWARFTLGAGLALPVMLAAVMVNITERANRNVRWTMSIGGLVAAMVYSFLLTDLDLGTHAWRTGLLYVALWSGLLLVAHASRRPTDNPRVWFWVVNRRLAERIVVVLSFAMMLWIGLALALLAIDTLFNANIHHRAYAHLGSALFFALVPTLVVGGLPEVMAPGAQEGRQLGVAGRWVVAYVMTPLTIVYTMILYAYHVKLIFDGELPQNTMSPLAGGAAILGLLSMLQLSAAAVDELPPISAKWLRVFPAVFLPMLPVPVWAVWLRVSDYGWTQFRIVRLVFLLVVVFVCVVGVSRLFQKRPTMQTWIVAPFAVSALLLAVGPFSANAISVRDQQARVVSLLQAADMLTSEGVLNTEAPFVAPASLVQNEHPGNGIAWLRDNKGDAYVADWLGLENVDLYDQLENLNLQRHWYPSAERPEVVWVHYSRSSGAPLEDVPGGTWHRVERTFGRSDEPIPIDRVPLRHFETVECYLDLSGLVPAALDHAQLDRSAGSFSLPTAFRLLEAKTASGEPCGTVVLDSASFRVARTDAGEVSLQGIDATLIR